MALRTGHGNGAGTPRVEVLPADELPAGVQGEALAEHRPERDVGGRFKPGARTAQSAGGAASRDKTRLARRLALGDTLADPRFEPFLRAARAFRAHHVTELARTVGGGRCGAAPSSIIASAALQLASSRFAFEVLGDMVLGSKLANDSRQNLLAAHELCAKEAQSRPRANSMLERMQAAAASSEAERS